MLETIDNAPKNEGSKVLALLQRAAEKGPPRTPERYRAINRKVGAHEFKTHEWRVFCFRDGQAFVCTHMASKNSVKKRDYPRHESDVLTWREKYRKDKRAGMLHIED